MGQKTNRSNMFYDEKPQSEEKETDLSPKVNEIPEETVETPEVIDGHVEMDEGNIIDLPSKGALGYPGSISHREIYAGDEEILKTATNKNFSRTMNRVLKSICNDVDWFDDITLHDRDYILTHIWANTYDSEKEFEVTCQHCGNKEDITVNMFELDHYELKDNFKSRFKVPIKKAGKDLYIRLMTVRDDNNAEKFLADNPKESYTHELVMLALACEFGRPMKVKDRIEFFKENVSARELGTMRQYHQYFNFGLDTTYEHVCSECEGVTRGEIPFRPHDVISPNVRTDFEQLLHDQ